MNRRRIGGKIDHTAYRALSDRGQVDVAEVQAAALRLFHEGQSARDIAGALCIPESLVQAWIAGATA